MKTAFEQWGRPEAIRFDNGKPWRNPRLRVPTALTLWLCGLGIKPLFGRPRQSTDNAVVERCHGVMDAWVEPQTCHDFHDLAHRLAYFAQLQRQQYPACHGQTRLQTFPQLTHPLHPYCRQQDQVLWHREQVLQYVAQFLFTRKVEKNGRITLMTHEYAIGRAYRSQHVTVQLHPDTGQWIVKDRDGQVLNSFPARQLTYSTIAGLKLSYANFRAKLDDA